MDIINVTMFGGSSPSIKPYEEVSPMERNVGTLDRIVRLMLAGGLMALAWNREDKLGAVAALNAGMLISSAASGFCPLYKVLNVNTVGKPF